MKKLIVTVLVILTVLLELLVGVLEAFRVAYLGAGLPDRLG